MKDKASTRDGDSTDLDELRARLAEAEDTLWAIRHGEVDALLIAENGGERVYTLRGADAPYRALVEQMHEGAVTLTTQGDIIYANRSFARHVDVPLEQVIGSSIDRFIEPADQATLRALVLDGMGTLRTALRTGSATPLDVHISVSHVTVDGVEHRTLIVTDISTLTKVQRESQSKDEFLAMLAHELRNPLAPIRTGLQVLRLQPGEEAAERTRAMMDRQILHMVRLIDDLLDVSRMTRGKIELKKELIDLKGIIGMAVETSLPLIEAGRHELSVRIPPESLTVEADPTRLGQVFSNLLNNAAKYTPDGGRLEVVARREQNAVHVSFKDNGVGIPKEMLPEVFEMFSQVGRNLDRAQGGLGIGLTLVRRLTELHGGSVKVESGGIGTGSVFTVSMPLAQSQRTTTHREHPSDAAPSGPAPRQLRVLVVDDNVDGAQMLSLLVGMQGHETSMAHNGPDAIKKLETFRPQLAFLDIGLPGLNGYEVARRVRASEHDRDGPRTILVALTGWGSDVDKARSQEAGFDLHLTKPVDAKDVETLLNGLPQRVSGGLNDA